MINKDLATTKTEKTGVLSTEDMLRRIHELQVENAELKRSCTALAEDLRVKEALLEQANILLAESGQSPDAQAVRDPVTGLMRHRAAMKVLSKQLARCKRHGEELAIGLCAIDSYKTISPEWKYKARSEVLQWLARMLTDNLREYDSVARIGNDTFLLIMPLKPENGAESVCERLCGQIASGAIKTVRGEIHITASIGIAYAASSSTVKGLMEEADAALDYALKQGGNRAVYFLKA